MCQKCDKKCLDLTAVNTRIVYTLCTLSWCFVVLHLAVLISGHWARLGGVKKRKQNDNCNTYNQPVDQHYFQRSQICAYMYKCNSISAAAHRYPAHHASIHCIKKPGLWRQDTPQHQGGQTGHQNTTSQPVTGNLVGGGEGFSLCANLNVYLLIKQLELARLF